MGSVNQRTLRKFLAEENPELLEPPKAGYLYRYRDASGSLLYVGISINAVARLGQHRGKDWFPMIAAISVERFDTYDEAQAAELKAICNEKPIHNVIGPRDKKSLQSALRRLRTIQKHAAKMASPRLVNIKGCYDCDMSFNIIPADTTFKEYVERWPYFKKFRES